MGRLVAEAVLDAGADLAGGVAGPAGTASGSAAPATLFASAGLLAQTSDVLIDFTHASAVCANADAAVAGRSAWVLGTTGLLPEHAQAVRRAAAQVAVVQAANFSPGVNLVLALAERLARALPADEYDAEIVEMHHRYKADAPSGTALAFGQAVAAGRDVALEDVIQPSRHGQTGQRVPGSIGFAALRGGQVVGEHTLLFAGDGEHIALTHRALDRRVFARGAVRAAVWAGRGRQPGLYSMMDVLGMAGPQRGA